VDTVARYTKQETGRIGEGVVMAWLKLQKGLRDAAPVNGEKNNFPIDITAGGYAVEVKAGTISNTKGAQQWRCTIGQPGPSEKSMIKLMTKKE